MQILRKLTLLLAAGLTVCSASFAFDAEKAAKLHEECLVVLADGDFEKAAQHALAAAKADPENKTYRAMVGQLAQVKKVRARLDQTKDPVMWKKIATSLRNFYFRYDILGEALKLDTRVHEKFKTAETAMDLGETQLEVGMNKEAVALLDGIAQKEKTARSQVLLGIGLAREGKMERAKKLAAEFGGTEGKEVSQLFDTSCLNALVGNEKLAASQMVSCLEQIAAAQHPRIIEYAKKRADLANLMKPEFEYVWKTESKVKAGGCGGCADSGGCSKKDTEEACGDGPKKDCDDKEKVHN